MHISKLNSKHIVLGLVKCGKMFAILIGYPHHFNFHLNTFIANENFSMFVHTNVWQINAQPTAVRISNAVTFHHSTAQIVAQNHTQYMQISRDFGGTIFILY